MKIQTFLHRKVDISRNSSDEIHENYFFLKTSEFFQVQNLVGLFSTLSRGLIPNESFDHSQNIIVIILNKNNEKMPLFSHSAVMAS